MTPDDPAAYPHRRLFVSADPEQETRVFVLPHGVTFDALLADLFRDTAAEGKSALFAAADPETLVVACASFQVFADEVAAAKLN